MQQSLYFINKKYYKGLSNIVNSKTKTIERNDQIQYLFLWRNQDYGVTWVLIFVVVVIKNLCIVWKNMPEWPNDPWNSIWLFSWLALGSYPPNTLKLTSISSKTLYRILFFFLISLIFLILGAIIPRKGMNSLIHE